VARTIILRLSKKSLKGLKKLTLIFKTILDVAIKLFPKQ
jgi:hypothetical protein